MAMNEWQTLTLKVFEHFLQNPEAVKKKMFKIYLEPLSRVP